MAGARTQGVGRGVNWGAFGAMGQQYAEIGRTIERGGSALGEGIGRGLGAIGGAIERKKERDQRAAERKQEFDYRAGRDAVEDARYAERNAEQNALFEQQLFQEQMESEYLQGRGPRAEREAALARDRNLGALAESFMQDFQQTQDPAALENFRRAVQAKSAAMAFPAVSPQAGREGGAAAQPFDDTAAAKDYLGRMMGQDILERPGMQGYEVKTPFGAIRARLLSAERVVRDTVTIKNNLENIERQLAQKNLSPMDRKTLERSRLLLQSAEAEVAGRKEVLARRDAAQRGMASAKRDQEQQARQAAEQQAKQEQDAAKTAARLKAESDAYDALAGDMADPALREQVRAGGLTAGEAHAEGLRRNKAKSEGAPKGEDGPKPITRSDMEQVAESLIQAGRLANTGKNDPDRVRSQREALEGIWAKGERAIAAMIASGEWVNLRGDAAKMLLERLGGDKRKAAAAIMKESPVLSDPEMKRKWAEVKALIDAAAPPQK